MSHSYDLFSEDIVILPTAILTHKSLDLVWMVQTEVPQGKFLRFPSDVVMGGPSLLGETLNVLSHYIYQASEHICPPPPSEHSSDADSDGGNLASDADHQTLEECGMVTDFQGL